MRDFKTELLELTTLECTVCTVDWGWIVGLGEKYKNWQSRAQTEKMDVRARCQISAQGSLTEGKLWSC